MIDLVLQGIALFFLMRPLGELLDVAEPVIMVLSTIAIAVFTGTLWRSTAKMQDVTARTLGHLEGEFRAEYRPWVSAENVEPVDDLQFSAIQGALLTVGFALKNAGRTPALHSRPNGVIFPFFTGGAREDVSADQERLLAEIAKRPMKANAIAEAIAPGQTVKLQRILYMSSADLDTYRTWYDNQKGDCTLILAGSVSYSSILGTSEYHTGLVFEVWEDVGIGNDERDMDWVEPKNVEGRRLAFSRSIYGTGIVD